MPGGFGAAYPEVVLNLREVVSNDLAAQVLAGQINAAIIFPDLPNKSLAMAPDRYRFAGLLADADGHRKWLAVAAIGGGKKVDVPALARRSSIPAGFLQKAREVVTAGTTLILSDLAVSPDTQSKPGFNILSASVAPLGTGH
jgi:hypothetical protein